MIPNIKKTEFKICNTTLIADLIEKLELPTVEADTRVNDLLEEAIEELLVKYENKSK